MSGDKYINMNINTLSKITIKDKMKLIYKYDIYSDKLVLKLINK